MNNTYIYIYTYIQHEVTIRQYTTQDRS